MTTIDIDLLLSRLALIGAFLGGTGMLIWAIIRFNLLRTGRDQGVIKQLLENQEKMQKRDTERENQFADLQERFDQFKDGYYETRSIIRVGKVSTIEYHAIRPLTTAEALSVINQASAQ